MAGRDNVLFHASVASSTAADTVIPLEFMYGVENVRQGYGRPVLKSVRAVYDGLYSGANANGIGVAIEIKNSNWIDSAGLVAQNVDGETALSKNSLAFMRGRDKELIPNTSWIVNATILTTTTAAGDIYVLFEIEYSDVPGYDPEKITGARCPVYKTCKNASVTGSANAVVPLGVFDNLLQNTEYILSEVSLQAPSALSVANFLVVEGFSNQRGLIRILPCKNFGMAEQIEGSVILTKQTYGLSMIRSAATTAAAVTVGLEMIANKN